VPRSRSAWWSKLGVVLAARARSGKNSASARPSADVPSRASCRATRDRAVRHGLDDPVSELASAERWLPDITWLPDGAGLAVDQCYCALDVLAVWAEAIERDVVFLKTADLFRVDVDLIFSTLPSLTSRSTSRTRTSRNLPAACIRHCASAATANEGRDNRPQVIIGLAVTRDGVPVRSWVAFLMPHPPE
jgi:hypothetical protein